MSTKKPEAFTLSKVKEINDDEMGFVRLSRALLTSPAWKHKSASVGKLLDFLFIEHLSHAGKENGNLLAPYKQLCDSGIGKQYINLVIQEAEELGLVVCDRGVRKNVCDSYPNKFRLTMFTYTETDSFGRTVYKEPTKEWKHITGEGARATAKKYKKLRSSIKQKTKL